MTEAVTTPAPHGAEILDVVTPSVPHPDPPPAVIAACFVVGTVALMILGVQPVLLEALTSAHRLTNAEVGPLATIEDLALALGAAIGPGWMRRGSIRSKAVALSLLLTGAHLGIYLADSTLLLDLFRAFAGLLEGLVLSAALVILIHHSQPDRLNGAFLGLSTLPQALMAYAVPAWITPRLGEGGGFLVLAGLSLVSAGVALRLPGRSERAQAEPAAPTRWRAPIVLALAAVALQNAAIGGAWTYLPLLVDQHHFAPVLGGVAVAGGLLFQVAGAGAVAAWGRRLPYRPSLVIGALCQTGVITVLAFAGAPWLFVGPALLFGLFWLALSPFQVRLLIGLDPSRGAAMLLTAVTLVGLSLGPAIAAVGVHGAVVTGALMIAAALMALSSGLYGLVAWASRSLDAAA